MAKKTKPGTLVGWILMALVLAALTGWGIWWLVSTYVSPTAARVWALVTTILLPIVFGLGYRLGLTESRGKLRGIDQGVDRVVRAAAAAIDLRAAGARAMREATRPELPAVVLPNPETIITVRPQIESGEIDL